MLILSVPIAFNPEDLTFNYVKFTLRAIYFTGKRLFFKNLYIKTKIEPAKKDYAKFWTKKTPPEAGSRFR